MIILNMMYDSIKIQNVAILIVWNLTYSLLAGHVQRKMIFKWLIIKSAATSPQIDWFHFVIAGKMEEYENPHALRACSHITIYLKNYRKQEKCWHFFPFWVHRIYLCFIFLSKRISHVGFLLSSKLSEFPDPVFLLKI